MSFNYFDYNIIMYMLGAVSLCGDYSGKVASILQPRKKILSATPDIGILFLVVDLLSTLIIIYCY